MEQIKTAMKTGAAIAVGAVVASPAFAIDVTDIDAGFTSGTAAVTTVVGGLIALTAVMLGIGIVLSLMKRS
tara:strand:+ start:3779 stop:3991 length:213 start_codon:yes stop_codon:yes gene_type:complete